MTDPMSPTEAKRFGAKTFKVRGRKKGYVSVYTCARVCPWSSAQLPQIFTFNTRILLLLYAQAALVVFFIAACSAGGKDQITEKALDVAKELIQYVHRHEGAAGGVVGGGAGGGGGAADNVTATAETLVIDLNAAVRKIYASQENDVEFEIDGEEMPTNFVCVSPLRFFPHHPFYFLALEMYNRCASLFNTHTASSLPDTGEPLRARQNLLPRRIPPEVPPRHGIQHVRWTAPPTSQYQDGENIPQPHDRLQEGDTGERLLQGVWLRF